MVENVNIANCLPKSLSYDGNYHRYFPWWKYEPGCPVKAVVTCGSTSRVTCNMAQNLSLGDVESSPAESKIELPECADYPVSFLLDSPSDLGVGRSMSCLSESDTSTYSEDYTTMTEDGEGTEQVPATPPHSESVDSFDSDRSSLGIQEDSPDMNVEECLSALENLTAGLGKHTKSGPPGPLISLSMADIDLQEAPPSPTALSPEDEDPTKGEGLAFYEYEDREFDFLKSEPVRRSTSLKTYKTPPGTPRRKKAVRFADALGLDLESVRHILNLEAPPKVPDSALKDLKVGLEEEHKTQGSRYLTACFSQPGADPDFISRVVAEKVVLENCVVDDQNLTVTGTARVSNITFHKKVSVRYSINGWMTYSDIEACYVHNSSEGSTDRFSFTIYLPPYFDRGSRLEFAMMYLVDGTTYWDNNFGRNYHVECYAKNIPTADHDSNWMHFL